jgi:UDP-N-acetylglucosamine--N-acetylmuramyl-(pentapeptide) pyrophosphoryl-undecaprenol N-acetylglucosamine transferase
VRYGATSDELRVAFAGGGTGGHLMPAAATATELKRMLPATRVMFMTTGREAEMRCAHALAGFGSMQIPATPWTGMRDKVRFPVKSIQAAERVLSALKHLRPHVLVGLGAADCVVPVLTARALGIRTVVLEANAVPGLAVKLLAPVADCVVLQYECAGRGLRARRVLDLGNPVRSHLFGVDRRAARRRLGLDPDRTTALVTGGSQGALRLNGVLFGALRLLSDAGVRLQVLHLTGVDHLPAALARAEEDQLNGYRPVGFMERMEDAYAAADFVVARSGASTLAELTALGLPSILIPYPYSAGGHQEINADVLAQAGAAIKISQRDLSDGALADAMAKLATNRAFRGRAAFNARRLGKPHAAERVAGLLATIAGFASRLPANADTELDLPSRAA